MTSKTIRYRTAGCVLDEEQLRKVESIHKKDLADGSGRVAFPEDTGPEIPEGDDGMALQWVFPQENRWRRFENRSGETASRA